MVFGESKFLANIFVFDTRYKHLKSQNNPLFYFFNTQDDYILAYHFANTKIIKYNFDIFFINFLIKFIIKTLLHYNINK